MNIVEKIKQNFDSMSKSERHVASYFLSHLNDFSFYTLDRTAAKIGTSTTTVIRFCRTLGYRGYKECQESLRSEMIYQPTLLDKLNRTMGESTEQTVLAQTIQHGVRCIEDTFCNITEDTLSRAVDMILDAEHIYTFGMKESYSLAHYCFTRFLTLRNHVHMLEAYNGNAESILSLSPADLCIVFLFHRYTRETLQLLPLIQKTGASILLITAEPFDSVAPFASLLLPCRVDAHGIKNTQLAPVCLMDYLCNAAALRMGDAAMIRMQKVEEAIDAAAINHGE